MSPYGPIVDRTALVAKIETAKANNDANRQAHIGIGRQAQAGQRQDSAAPHVACLCQRELGASGAQARGGGFVNPTGQARPQAKEQT